MAYGDGTNAPYGLNPIQTATNSTWTASYFDFTLPSAYGTNIFTNDPIALVNGSIVIGAASNGTAGNGVSIGTFQGCQYTDAQRNFVSSPYWPANTVLLAGTVCTVKVSIDPYIVYDVQTNSTNGLVLTDVGANYNFAIGSGNTATGQSTTILDLSSSGGSSTYYNCKVIGLTKVPGNAYGVAYNSALVILNNHLLNSPVAGV